MASQIEQVIGKGLPLGIGVFAILNPQRRRGDQFMAAIAAKHQNRLDRLSFHLDTRRQLVIKRPFEAAHVKVDPHRLLLQ